MVDDMTGGAEGPDRLGLIGAGRQKKASLRVARPSGLTAIPRPLETIDDAPTVRVLPHLDPADGIGLGVVLTVVPVGLRDHGPKFRVDREGAALGHRNLDLVGGHGGGLSCGSIAASGVPSPEAPTATGEVTRCQIGATRTRCCSASRPASPGP